jgi:GntR family transcriptional regulator/MocR family aminotransferase
MIALREQTEGSRFAWLYGELRTAILSGRLAPGSRVPSTRQLADAYRVARGTVVAVFEQLLSEGYVTCTTGSGTYVAESLPDNWFRASVPRTRPATTHATDDALSTRGRRLARHRWMLSTAEPRPFRTHHPAIDAQTLAIWKRLCGRVGAGDAALALTANPSGYEPLRVALAEHLGRVRGLRCSPEQIIVLASTHQSLDLAARLLTDPGDTVLVEDPGYPGSWSMFEINALRLRSLPVDADGADIGRVDADAEGARMAYVTPAHQFPLGVMMSIRRRLELLSWASRRDAWIIEDDYDGEYRFTSRPISALAGLDEHERVIYTGTLNKVLFPTLRLAYIVVPRSLAEAFAAARATMDRCPPISAQLVMSEFIREGHFDRHLRRMRALYEERLHVFSEVIEDQLGDEFELTATTTGLQTVCWLRRGHPDREVARAAWERGVEVSPVSRYRLERPIRAGLQCGFGAFDRSQMLEGAKRLREALRTVSRAREPDLTSQPVLS